MPHTPRKLLWWFGLPFLLLLLLDVACTEPDTRIQITRCPSGEIASLQVSVLRNDARSQGACPTSQPPAAFTLTKPCDTPTQFQLPNLADGEQLLFWFQRGSGRTPYCETCKEGTQTNAEGKCSLQGPPPCESQERCGDGIDNDCDGEVDEDCKPTPEPATEPPLEVSQEPVETQPEPTPEPTPEPRTEPVTDAANEPAPEPTPEPIPEPTPERGGCEQGPAEPGAMSKACGEKRAEKPPERRPEVTGCRTSADCGGVPCRNSRCSTSSALCSTSAECSGPHERCIKNGCHQVAALCTTDADCPNQEACRQGICQVCAGTPLVCKQPTLCQRSDKTACSSGFLCSAGFCAKTCSTIKHVRCPSLPRMKCYEPAGASEGVCLLSCTNDNECPQTYTCRIDPATALGFCVRR